MRTMLVVLLTVVTIIGVLVIGLGGDAVEESVVIPATPTTPPSTTGPEPTTSAEYGDDDERAASNEEARLLDEWLTLTGLSTLPMEQLQPGNMVETASTSSISTCSRVLWFWNSRMRIIGPRFAK